MFVVSVEDGQCPVVLVHNDTMASGLYCVSELSRHLNTFYIINLFRWPMAKFLKDFIIF